MSNASRFIAASLALAALAFATPRAEQPAASKSGKLALVGGMLLDGYEAGPIHHAAVLIDGERIVRVGPAAEITIPPDYQIVDTSGRTMMPGMIELHGHLIILGHGNYGTWFPWVAKQGPGALTKVMEISARQLLNAGITSAVDLGAPLAESLSVRDRINKGEIPGPRMSMSGPWITRSRGGMTDQFGGISISSPEQAAAEVERWLAESVLQFADAGRRMWQGGLEGMLGLDKEAAAVGAVILDQLVLSAGRHWLTTGGDTHALTDLFVRVGVAAMRELQGSTQPLPRPRRRT